MIMLLKKKEADLYKRLDKPILKVRFTVNKYIIFCRR
jgi:hypothetical protein